MAPQPSQQDDGSAHQPLLFAGHEGTTRGSSLYYHSALSDQAQYNYSNQGYPQQQQQPSYGVSSSQQVVSNSMSQPSPPTHTSATVPAPRAGTIPTAEVSISQPSVGRSTRGMLPVQAPVLGTWAHRQVRLPLEAGIQQPERQPATDGPGNVDHAAEDQARADTLPEGQPRLQRRSSESDGDPAAEAAAWRWRFARRWHQEQTRAMDPENAAGGSPDKTEEALAYLQAGGGAGWNMQVRAEGRLVHACAVTRDDGGTGWSACACTGC